MLLQYRDHFSLVQLTLSALIIVGSVTTQVFDNCHDSAKHMSL